MKLTKVGTFKYSNTKEFLVYEDENKIKYIAKQTKLSNYPLLNLISNISLDSDHLGQIRYFYKHQDKLVYYTQLYDGKTLEQVILEKKQLSVEQVRDIIYQIALGLDDLHKHGIIHRDIKPANIMIVNNQVKVIDYDISRVYDDDKHQDTTNFGTKYYAPPEQYGYRQTDITSDIFSLGKTIEQLVLNCVAKDEQIEFVAFINKASAFDPDDRFKNCSEVINFVAKNKLIDSVKKRIIQLQQVCNDQELINRIVKRNLNEKQIGVIRHALEEGISQEVINLMLSDDFDTRQMWQIKRGEIDGLAIDAIYHYAKIYYSPEDMAIFRANLNQGIDLVTIYNRIKMFNLLVNTKQLSSDVIRELKVYFYYHDYDNNLESILDLEDGQAIVKLNKLIEKGKLWISNT